MPFVITNGYGSLQPMHGVTEDDLVVRFLQLKMVMVVKQRITVKTDPEPFLCFLEQGREILEIPVRKKMLPMVASIQNVVNGAAG